jgi:hypothetical protein
MGNDSSKEKGQKSGQPSNPSTSSQQPGRNLRDTKKVLLVHMSGTEQQVRVVRHFRDALTGKANGNVKVEKFANIANEDEIATMNDSHWLDEVNNVVLLSLKSEAISPLRQIMREKNYVNDGRLHDKVFSVSFGKSFNDQWPKGIQRRTEDARDFAFNFENVDQLTPNDFEKSEKMSALVAAIKGASLN